MTYEVKVENQKAKIKIELNQEEWAAALNDAYIKTKFKYGIQGFRKGHTPKKVIESIYGEEVFYNDALSDIFPKYYGEVLEKEKDLFVISDPQVDFEKIDKTGLILVLDVELKPEIVVENYKGIKVEKVEYNVTDESIDAEIDRAKERAAREVNVTDRAVINGDMTIIDYSGSVDGVKFDGGTAEKQELTIGSNRFIPGFEEQLVGMEIGTERDINVKFPENYSPELAGKDAVFHIKLHEIKAKEYPELNDEFAKDVSEFDSMQEYREDIRKKQTEQNEKRAKDETTNALIEKIADSVVFDVPKSMVDRQVENQIKMNSQQAQMYYGINFEDLLKQQGQSIDDFKKAIEKDCEKKVKISLVFDAIIKQENLEASDAEMEEKLKFLAESTQKDFEEYKNSVKPQQLDYIKEDIVTEKLLKLLNEYNPQ